MDADIAYADSCLDAWATWVKGGTSAWPGVTLLGRVMEQGTSGAAQTGAPLSGLPDHVLLTDRAVAKLDAILKRVIVVYYLTYADQEAKAVQCGCSKATFWRRVQRGQKAVYRYRQDFYLADEINTAYSQAS